MDLLPWRTTASGSSPSTASGSSRSSSACNAREQYPGTGIGLAICRKIVEQHLGRIWIDASRAPGAVFHFTLPKAEDLPPTEAPAADTESAPRDAEAEHSAGGAVDLAS